jgi:hypothetical protein
LPLRAGKFISDITADAALVFAGIFANLAPLLGPGASVPAAAGQAATMGQLALVPKFESGAYNVPMNTLAYIHQGEMIVPASFAEGMRNGGRGMGGGDINVHFTNNGGGMSDEEIMRHSETIAKAVRSEIRGFSPHMHAAM